MCDQITIKTPYAFYESDQILCLFIMYVYICKCVRLYVCVIFQDTLRFRARLFTESHEQHHLFMVISNAIGFPVAHDYFAMGYINRKHELYPKEYHMNRHLSYMVQIHKNFTLFLMKNEKFIIIMLYYSNF